MFGVSPECVFINIFSSHVFSSNLYLFRLKCAPVIAELLGQGLVVNPSLVIVS